MYSTYLFASSSCTVNLSGRHAFSMFSSNMLNAVLLAGLPVINAPFWSTFARLGKEENKTFDHTIWQHRSPRSSHSTASISCSSPAEYHNQALQKHVW